MSCSGRAERMREHAPEAMPDRPAVHRRRLLERPRSEPSDERTMRCGSKRPATAAPSGVWQELSEYADGLRHKVDDSGEPKFVFPDDYDEVVGLMSRGDLSSSSWATAAIHDGVRLSCSKRVGLQRYRELFEHELNRDRLLVGFARIEQLDRKLRKRQARARAVAEKVSGLIGLNSARSESTIDSSDKAFVTEVKRVASRRRREDVAVPFNQTLDREIRLAKLTDPELSTAEERTVAELSRAYGPSEEDETRLVAIDAELRAIGVDESRLSKPPLQPGPEKDVLRCFRAHREDRARELDVDRRLAATRDAPLVLLDDDEVDDFEASYSSDTLIRPPCASDLRALVAALLLEKPLPKNPAQKAQVRATVDSLASTMRDKITTLTLAREARRARKKRYSTDETPPVTPDASITSSTSVATLHKDRFHEHSELSLLSDALLKISLKTNSAVQNADAAIRRARSFPSSGTGNGSGDENT